ETFNDLCRSFVERGYGLRRPLDLLQVIDVVAPVHLAALHPRNAVPRLEYLRDDDRTVLVHGCLVGDHVGSLDTEPELADDPATAVECARRARLRRRSFQPRLAISLVPGRQSESQLG